MVIVKNEIPTVRGKFKGTKERVYLIDNYGKFTATLHGRLDAMLSYVEDFEAQDYTLIINVVDRTSRENQQKKILMQAGTDRQRELLENYNHITERDHTLDSHWEFLKTSYLRKDIKELATYELFNQFESSQLGLDSIEVGYLKNYFKEISNEFQKHEYPILSKYFNTTKANHIAKERKGKFKSDCYISIPLIQFGLFEGVVHIIFRRKYKKYFNENKIKRIIKIFSAEYENLLLDWDLENENLFKLSSIRFGHLFDEHFYTYAETNPILRELNYYQYYKRSQRYLEERIELNNFVPRIMEKQQQKLIKQYRKTAIISILIDSYAHNISAHSLTALNWAFKERANLLRVSELFKAAQAAKDLEAMEKYREYIRPLLKRPIVKATNPLAPEIHPLLNFLLEKGAFWSGITRGNNFGGKIVDFYTIFWNDFINNPLYLGTIAQTEDINRLNIFITIYREDSKIDKYRKRKNIKRNKNGIKLSGALAHIDLNQFRKHNSEEGGALEQEFKDLDKRSSFVEMGALYKPLRNYLNETFIFLPGGVVGKHSLFTLIENEIRNVKHYKGAALKEMQTGGLTLHLSLQLKTVKPFRSQKEELYQIGIWLHHQTPLRGEDEDLLILRKVRGLQGDVMTDKYHPKLGGNFQDKICAAMLFNNEFDSVQNQASDRDNAYYPWLISATEAIDRNSGEPLGIDFEITPHSYQEKEITSEVQNRLGKEVYDNLTALEQQNEHIKVFTEQSNYSHQHGYLKKYFHVWRGETISSISYKKDFEWENIARFKFLYVEEGDFANFQLARTAGVFRIIKERHTKNVISCYQLWLARWLNKDAPQAIFFQEDDTEIGAMVYQNNQLAFYNQQALEENTILDFSKITQRQTLSFAHGMKSSEKKHICNYRTHGRLMQYFFRDNNDISTAQLGGALLYEFFEILATKICIFDKRVAGRVSNLPDKKGKTKRDFFKTYLNCGFYEETMEAWNRVKQEGILTYNFFVIHLSFIEAMICTAGANKGKRYTEDTIDEFIKYEILQGKQTVELQDNFILVITTGRGRTQWWKSIQNTEYRTFTTFRPIESLIAGTENAIQMNDDIDVKYNLIKVLFGS